MAAHVSDGNTGFGEWQNPNPVHTLLPSATRITSNAAQRQCVTMQLVQRQY